ncbi:MAG TPA: TerC family protein [bacterium]|nr:TerC family protein [bacterium]
MEVSFMWWVWFNAFIVAMVLVDLLVFHKKDHVVSVKEALVWSFVWITMALLFNLFILLNAGKQPALEYFTAYIIEKSLSVDNLFVFIVIFNYFRVPPQYQHRVLFIGVIVVMVLRAVFILAGIRLVEEFHWLLYVFGIFLVYIAVKMVSEKDKEYDPSKNIVVRLFSKLMPMSLEYKNHNFFERVNGKLAVTQLFVVLMVINFVDLVFAIDSIPAVFAITRDPFIVYTSNIFAILGLRALYFAVSGVLRMFKYLKYGLALILAVVGVKMVLIDIVKVPTLYSLIFIVTVLAVSILFSVVKEKRRG